MDDAPAHRGTIMTKTASVSMICAVVVVAVLPLAPASRAANCAAASIGSTPLSDLGPGFYLGSFQGGLYPGGVNTPPAAHHQEGLSRAQQVPPLDAGGNPTAAGRYVLLSIGMSNATQEFCSENSLPPCDAWTFMGQAAVHPDVDTPQLAIINGAFSGQAASAWQSPASPNYQRISDDHLTPNGLTASQVQVAWVKLGNPFPSVSLPDAGADAFELAQRLGDIMRTLKGHYPNLQIVLLSSRIYGGYASTALNPEPYAYEGGFGVKHLIAAQIAQMAGGGIDPLVGDLDYASDVVPWLAWGPDLWADGLTPRSDGLTWECSDVESDGAHPAQSGEQKVGSLLMDFMLQSPYSAPWFRAEIAAPALSPPALGVLLVALVAAGGLALRR